MYRQYYPEVRNSKPFAPRSETGGSGAVGIRLVFLRNEQDKRD